MPTTPQDRKKKLVDPYEFTVSGEKFEIPQMASLATFSTMRRIRKLDPIDQAFTLLEDCMSANDLRRLERVLDPLGDEGVNDFLQGWQENSEITLGESTAS